MDLPHYLASGEAARLIPVAADSKREARAASILLATLAAVPSFASAMLASVGLRTGTRARVTCFTEVVLKGDNGEPKCRPDGLIVLDSGRGRTWSCLLEAKIGNADLECDQVERYLSLAKGGNINSVLTISNQFVALPTHTPVKVPKAALRGVDLFHWSWMNVVTQAELLLNEDEFDHPSQKYLLQEMSRYFQHPSIGVSTFDRMNPEWKDLVTTVQAGGSLNKSDKLVENSVAAWHQEARDVCLKMTRRLYRPVRIKLSRAHTLDPIQRLKDDCERLVKQYQLEFALEIPDAAAPLVVVADVLRRSISVSMSLAAPTDKQRASSRINWMLRQLSKTDSGGIYVKATWPGRAPMTQAALSDLKQNPGLLEGDNKALVPGGFEVTLVRDLAGKFSGQRTFIEHLEDAVPQFYEQVGQHVRPYVAAPPKIAGNQKEEETPISKALVVCGEVTNEGDKERSALTSLTVKTEFPEPESVDSE